MIENFKNMAKKNKLKPEEVIKDSEKLLNFIEELKNIDITNFDPKKLQKKASKIKKEIEKKYKISEEDSVFNKKEESAKKWLKDLDTKK